jgi:hypothetical protein
MHLQSWASWAATLATFGVSIRCGASTLDVGEHQKFTRIELALAEAKPGDTVRVHALAGNAPYPRVALLIRTPDLHIIAVADPARPDQPVPLSGEGMEYSGQGTVPRAIVQFDPQAEGCSLEGFELSAARNRSHNGAGVRINQANHVSIRSCVIHDNDMGVMSNGNGQPTAAVDQRIERCLIHSNGSSAEPGQNHNLYLGGTSVVLTGCEIRSSTTGHNVKSRAHYTRVEYCWIHDAASRELDLVDGGGDTSVPHSDAVVLGCVIVKRDNSSGNRGVIHFGEDGGHGHVGTLFLVQNTIVTPYVTPVVEMSSSGSSVLMANNLITDHGAGSKGQKLVAALGKNAPKKLEVRGSGNHFSDGFADIAGLGKRLATKVRFSDPAHGDWRVIADGPPDTEPGAELGAIGLPAAPGRAEDHPGVPLLRYAPPRSCEPRGEARSPSVGAAGLAPRG